ncbi:MAG: hypothetical protein J6N18_08990 [Kiritimatiellae bacterium]|nr:hypothetical protein [Kiritimatiellia bacterium]
MKRMNVFAAAVFCAAASCFASGPVTSGFVPVCKPGEVFAPVPEANGSAIDAARVIDTPVVFPAAYTEDFTLDGDVTKAVWKKAKPCGEFLAMKGRGKFGQKTELKLLYSSTALYIGAVFHQPMDKIKAQYDQDDQPIFNDDNMEIIMLLPSEEGEDLIQMAFNALGSCYDSSKGRSSWNVRGRKTAARRLSDRWMIEIKLPYRGLGIDRPVPGDFIGARFCRFVSNPWTRASIPQLETIGNNQRRKFGKVLFEEPDGKAAAEARAFRDRIAKERFAARLAEAKRRIASQEAASMHFVDPKHDVFIKPVQAIAQMKAGLEKFGKKQMSSKDFLALDAGFRRFAANNAYAVWTTSPWEKGSPDRLPPKDALGVPYLKFEQAGNEREAVCLEFTGLLCGPRLDLRLVPQHVIVGKGKAAKFVSCDAFEIYEEPFVRFENELMTAPLIQKDGNIITVSPGRITRVWVVFNSRNVEPGEYKTRILLKSAWDMDVAEKSIETEMKVWNFTLPETRDWPFQTFFWGPNTFDNDETQVLKLLHSRHVTHGWTKSQLYTFGLRQDRYVKKRAGKNDPVYFDRHLTETENEEFFRTAKDLGMRFVFGWGTPDRTPEWFRLMTGRLNRMGFKPGDYIFKTLIRDEFMKKDIPANAARRAAVTKEFGTNLWFQAVYLSTPPPSGATMDDIEAAKLPEFYKMWTVIDGVFRDEKRGEEVTRRLRTKGCKVWSYMCARYMQTKDVLNYYRFYLWRCYMRGLDGAAMWTFGSRNGDDGFDSRDGYDDGILWCGQNKQMVPTKRFEAWREGLEDIAYMDLLAKAMARAKAKGRDVSKAQSLLDARADVVRAHDQEVLDDWRLSAGRLIDSL